MNEPKNEILPPLNGGPLVSGHAVDRTGALVTLAAFLDTVQCYTNSNHDALDFVGATVPGQGPPVIWTQPQTDTVAVGASGTFSVEVLSAGPVSYQWFWNGSAISGATNSSYTVASVQYANKGLYSVLVANNAGAVMSQAASLTVPDPSGNPGRVYLFSGNLSPSAWTDGDTYVQLYAGPSMDNLVPVSAALKTINASSYLPASISSALIPPNKNSYFQLRGWTGTTTNFSDAWVIGFSEILSTNAAGAPTSPTPVLRFNTMELFLWDRYQFYTSVTTNGSTSLGGTVHFVATGHTTEGFSDPPFIPTDTGWPTYYQWRKDGVNIPGATGSTLTITNLRGSSAGDYSVVFYNGREAYALHISLTVDFTPHLNRIPTSESVSFSMLANPGSPVVVQGSTNLTSWDDLTTVTSVSDSLRFDFPIEAVPQGQRFYRAVLKP